VRAHACQLTRAVRRRRPGHGVFRPHMLRTLRALGLTGALGDAYGHVGCGAHAPPNAQASPAAARRPHARPGPRARPAPPGPARRWDPRNRSGRLVAALLLRSATPGSVLIAHDGCAARVATLDALRLVLPELRRRGFAVVTLSQLAAAAEEEAATDAVAAARGVADARA
jgi:hypothetical protein